MILSIIVIFVLLALLAIINWKLPIENVKIATRLVSFMLNAYVIIAPLLILRPYFEQDISNAVLFMFILLLAFLLLFAITVYIPYARNRADVKVMQDTIKQSILFNIALIILVVIMIVATILYTSHL